ncbi:bifunctional ADP-dependent NAD(P)H-hydrate dehydratase/NAD(P)H-hydrate epimerase [Sphingomonas endophytica]|uniref:Bifunctional NAD(P)H-hydrate repair enzyme n=1 Tax=Sphingomonas endophytica TaxID=869719 RepID=A0A147I1S4_9SPHN|nr:bifunctional ADP-dependent NAD(P)H-hydrate dehydratase/NAD(P)H-hydrate epimerase [Sphingomonas endophytica]KTT71547.1 carbohydrate kinase [Sphingomonas endophytica]
MIPIAGTAVLTAAQMRAAEEKAIAAGTGVDTLMQRAGAGVADAVRRLAGVNEVLVLCGPGNNGGDGYVAAARLHAAGPSVRVAASAEPRTPAAIAARALWTGAVEPLATAAPAPVVVDALFGTGLSRALDTDVSTALNRFVSHANLAIAVDLPSGIATDDGALLGDLPAFHVTLALGAAKPAHLLQPSAVHCGAVRLLPIGVTTDSDVRVLSRPDLPAPAIDAHKFTRGMVAVIRGRMAGAAQLAAQAAMHAGAGYVEILGATIPGAPHALVRRRCDDSALADPRIGAVLIGPGLGRDDAARALLDQALATDRPLVIDGDALHLVTPERLHGRPAETILTPHAGEFAALFAASDTDKLTAARAAATRANATIVFKGPDTVIAAADGRAVLSPAASSWLSTAGSGDVLAGAIAAMLAGGGTPLDAAAAGVWLHGEAARRLGPAFIADDLAEALTGARA